MNRMIILGNGDEAKRYAEMLSGVGRDYAIVEAVNTDEIDNNAFLIVGDEDKRTLYEKKANYLGCSLVPHSYMQYNIWHHFKSDYINILKMELEKQGVELLSCFSSSDETRVIVKIANTFHKRISLKFLRLCEDGEIVINNLRFHVEMGSAIFENGVSYLEIETEESDLLLELILSKIDIPYFCVRRYDTEYSMAIDGIDNDIVRQVFMSNLERFSNRTVFHEEDYLFLKNMESSHLSIVDLGSNYGQSIISFRKLVPFSTITSYEANPELHGVLSLLGKSQNVEFVNMGVSDQCGHMMFYYVPDHIYISGSFFREDLEKRLIQQSINGDIHEIKVRVTTIDDEFADKRVDFIKLDIEGAEYKALCGGINTIRANRPLILIENHGDQQKKIDELLDGYHRYYYNYHDNVLIKENKCHSINYYMVPDDDKRYSDWIR